MSLVRQNTPETPQTYKITPKTKTFDVYVKDITGRTVTIQMKASDSVFSLLSKYCFEIGQPLKMVRLVFHNKNITAPVNARYYEDYMTSRLYQWGIREGDSTVYGILRLGGPNSSYGNTPPNFENQLQF